MQCVRLWLSYIDLHTWLFILNLCLSCLCDVLVYIMVFMYGHESGYTMAKPNPSLGEERLYDASGDQLRWCSSTMDTKGPSKWPVEITLSLTSGLASFPEKNTGYEGVRSDQDWLDFEVTHGLKRSFFFPHLPGEGLWILTKVQLLLPSVLPSFLLRFRAMWRAPDAR